MTTLTITINGQQVTRDIEEHRTLAEFLRYEMNL
jgi:aerobic-type carbon monoxide dehydrogenase small subunit (CoxS/CutS family)